MAARSARITKSGSRIARTSPQSAAHFRMQADPPGDAAHQLDARPAGHGNVLRQFRRRAPGSWRRVSSVSLRVACQQSRLLKVAVRLLIVNSCLRQQRCSNRRSAEVAGDSAMARTGPASMPSSGPWWPMAAGRSYFQRPVPRRHEKFGPAVAPGNLCEEAGSTPASANRCCHRIEREARPPMRCAGRRGRPPQLLRRMAAR